jgi:NTP pyrophosphatase (non-canonical NTP hydrolase)
VSKELFLAEMIDQCTEDSQRWFPGSQSLDFLALCLAGEVGEVANIIKKNVRGSGALNTEHLAEEVVDVLIYLCNMMGQEEFIDVDWMDVWYKKRAFNEARFGHGLNHPGSDRWTGGDKKDEL